MLLSRADFVISTGVADFDVGPLPPGTIIQGLSVAASPLLDLGERFMLAASLAVNRSRVNLNTAAYWGFLGEVPDFQVLQGFPNGSQFTWVLSDDVTYIPIDALVLDGSWFNCRLENGSLATDLFVTVSLSVLIPRVAEDVVFPKVL